MRYWQILLLSVLGFAQNKNVDFKTAYALVEPDAAEKSVRGAVTYSFEVLSKTDTIFIDAVKMDFSDVQINGKTVNYKNSGKTLKLFEGFKKGRNTLKFRYKAVPKQTLYFIGIGENLQIWSQGQGKYTSHWLPSFDDVNEKVIFNISVVFDAGFEVLSNGILQKKETGTQKNTWHYTMKKPMSSYLVMLAAGKFVKQTEITASGTKLEYYLDRNDADKFATTYKYTREIFDFFEKETGFAYPWEIYRQVPVRDFLYSGMENTTSTIFAQDFVVDAVGFHDRTYVNVNAHELAHQWFGNVVTAQTGKHHWLQEGFATYYALLAEKELFGDDHFSWELYEMAERLQMASKTDTIPILNEKASSLTFYQKGAWALHILREQVGKENFAKAVKNYLKKYAFKNVNTTEFLAEIEKVSKTDTGDFRRKWLEAPGFPIQEALTVLKKNAFIESYLSLVSLQEVPFEAKKDRLRQYLEGGYFYPVKQEVLYQISEVPAEEKKDLVRTAFASEDIKIRQALAQSLTEIPDYLQADYESLLYDKSYITQEIALGTLWRLFPHKQAEYLEISKQWIGFDDKNLRILWLTLALITQNYQNDKKAGFYDELLHYASGEYPAAIRQNALTNLLYLNPNDSNILQHLVNAATHHKWRFTLFARNNIRELLKSEKHRKHFEEMLPSLNDSEQTQLKRMLEEK